MRFRALPVNASVAAPDQGPSPDPAPTLLILDLWRQLCGRSCRFPRARPTCRLRSTTPSNCLKRCRRKKRKENKAQSNAPGLVPMDRSADPAPTPALIRETRQSTQRGGRHSGSNDSSDSLLGRLIPRKVQKKKTPAPEGARVFRRMGEGLGAGGHSTRRWTINVQAAGAFQGARNYFRAVARGRRRWVRAARSIGRSTCRPSGNSRYRKWIRRRPSPPPRPSIT
jgi:hypothetical protein